MNEAKIYRLYMANRLSQSVDYDQFLIGIETEHDSHPHLSDDELVELVVKKLEIEPEYYAAHTESSIEEIEPIGEPHRPLLPRSIPKPKRTRIERTLPPGEREDNPSSRREINDIADQLTALIEAIHNEGEGSEHDLLDLIAMLGNAQNIAIWFLPYMIHDPGVEPPSPVVNVPAMAEAYRYYQIFKDQIQSDDDLNSKRGSWNSLVYFLKNRIGR